MGSEWMECNLHSCRTPLIAVLIGAACIAFVSLPNEHSNRSTEVARHEFELDASRQRTLRFLCKDRIEIEIQD